MSDKQFSETLKRVQKAIQDDAVIGWRQETEQRVSEDRVVARKQLFESLDQLWNRNRGTLLSSTF